MQSPSEPPVAAAPSPVYSVAVRELCEFTAKHGDLDLRFTPAPTAQEGITGHATVAARREPGYRKEVGLTGDYGPLRVRGRADGYSEARNELEEVKTFRGDLERMPDNHRGLHWAQLKVYGWLICRERELAEIRLSLVYYDVDRDTETLFSERHEADSLREFFEDQCRRFLYWAELELAHRQRRNRALATVGFPHPEFHAGQRQLAEAVYRSAARGGVLMAQAPTGIGKSIGTLFPALKALAADKLDKVFFLTAKTSGRKLALDALVSLAKAGDPVPLRVLELVARDKSCEHPDRACHGESCPLAKGFYDRLPAARAAAAEQPEALTQPTLRRVALEHGVCPYYLSQDLVRWSDVVVGDYNYYFDGSALLHGLAAVNDWRTGVLVDEAHNLVERGRAMYSAELDQSDLAALRRSAPAALRKSLDRLNRAWNKLHRDQEQPYATLPQLPGAWLGTLQDVVSAMGAHFAEHPQEIDPVLQRHWFDFAQFQRLAESFGEHSLFDVQLTEGGKRSTLCIRNVVPAPFLAPRIAAAQGLALFSATLSPAHFYRDLLGLPDDSVLLDVPSPFSSEQLQVQFARRISTRYRDRQQSLAPIADLMAQQYRQRPGNYLAFFSSFDYLRQAAEVLGQRHPDLPMWQQERQMSEAERAAFVERFAPDGCGIGFAVLGGVFGEGIDLPGERLVGAFIATLGLPQVNPVNEEMRRRMDALFGAGYDYVYRFPGLQKVVQAAGRVIRTVRDRGTLVLIDDRYRQADTRALLPVWWKL